MKSIQVFEPPMRFSTGPSSFEVDPNFVTFDDMLLQFRLSGIRVERFNLAQQPMAFAQNDTVKSLMIKEGTQVLPVVLWDGELHLKGRYPNKHERPAWFRAASSHNSAAA